MKKLSPCFCLLLLVFLSDVLGGLSQAKKTPDKDRPAVTMEMMRHLGREIDAKVHVAREQGNKLTELNALRALEPEYAK